MVSKVKPIPEGVQAVTPYLITSNAGEMIEFYKKVFGATELERHDEPSGKVSMAHIKIGNSPLMVSDETSEHVQEHAHESDARSPESLGGASGSVQVYVPDADLVFKRAVAAGATVIRPLEDRRWGDRMGEIKDPFGHIWCIATHKRNVPSDQH